MSDPGSLDELADCVLSGCRGVNMPAWVRAIARVNPLSYEVNALRQLLLGLPGNLAMDFAALLGATVAGITAASLLLGRLAR